MAYIYGTNASETLYGTNNNDSIYGYKGNDTIFALGGHDYINGGEGADTMYGSFGNDYYVVDNYGDKVIEYAGQGVDTVYTTISGYTLTNNVENLSMGGSIYSGYGNSLNNTIWGNSANNYINGGKGADTMYGYGGNDYYVVDNYGDKVIESAGKGTDTVYTTISGYTLTNNVENLSMGGSIYSGYGNSLNNTIWATAPTTISMAAKALTPCMDMAATTTMWLTTMATKSLSLPDKEPTPSTPRLVDIA